MKKLHPDNTSRTGTPEHIKAMSTHRGLAIFYFGLALLLTGLLVAGGKSASTYVMPLFPLALGSVHAAVALGARRSAVWARRSSIALACLMLLAVPIGTFIGIYLLSNSKWSASAAA